MEGWFSGARADSNGVTAAPEPSGAGSSNAAAAAAQPPIPKKKGSVSFSSGADLTACGAAKQLPPPPPARSFSNDHDVNHTDAGEPLPAKLRSQSHEHSRSGGFKWVIDPRDATWLAYWDLVTSVALIFTSTVTPYEVAFLTPAPNLIGKLQSGLFWVNRSVDLVFIFDMCTQFRVAFKTGGTNVRWVLEPWPIAVHYVCSKWFWIDLFSILTLLFDLLGDESSSNLTGLRAVRILRMAKLVRLLRGSRIFKTWEMRLSINYAYLELLQCMVMILWACHMWACVWGMQATFAPLHSWPAGKDYCVPWGHEDEAVARQMLLNGTGVLDPLNEYASKYTDFKVGQCSGGICVEGVACVDAWHLYAYSLYFAVMTITSVGYGDVVAMPFNPTEQILCSIIMLLSGMLWGYLIGTFCGLAAGLSPVIKAFREDLSSLNSFMSEHDFPSETRFRMREYFHQTIHLRKLGVQKVLLENLSPAMQAEISFLVNARWVEQVWYLQRAFDQSPVSGGGLQISGHGLRMQLAAHLSPFVFPPGEFCPNGFMYIIQRGSALWAGHMLREGNDRRSVWGDDVILYNRELQILFPALAATYLHVLTIDGESLNRVVYKFPDVMPYLHKICRRWIVRRCIVREAERIVYGRGERFRGRHQPIYARELISSEARQASGNASFGRVTTLRRQRTRFGARIMGELTIEAEDSLTSNSSTTRKLLRQSTERKAKSRRARSTRSTVGSEGSSIFGRPSSPTLLPPSSPMSPTHGDGSQSGGEQSRESSYNSSSAAGGSSTAAEESVSCTTQMERFSKEAKEAADLFAPAGAPSPFANGGRVSLSDTNLLGRHKVSPIDGQQRASSAGMIGKSSATSTSRRLSILAHGAKPLTIFKRAAASRLTTTAEERVMQRVQDKKRKASVHHAATEFGLDEMKANMLSRIADKGSAEVRIKVIEEKVDSMMPILKNIELFMAGGGGGGGVTIAPSQPLPPPPPPQGLGDKPSISSSYSC